MQTDARSLMCHIVRISILADFATVLHDLILTIVIHVLDAVWYIPQAT